MTEALLSNADWVRGDSLGLDMPAHAEALAERGTDWLTAAFRASGALPQGRVAAITRFDPLVVGGTGTKLILSVAYEGTVAPPPTELFVKFSRNFADPIRDAARHHMAGEVKLAVLSRDPAFPIAVPACLFADFHAESGTGMLITERIAYGVGGIEPHWPKCMDHKLPEPLDHYRALMTALGRLAGTHKAGGLGAAVEAMFPLDREALIAADRNPYDPERLTNRVKRMVAFVAAYPQLFPARVSDPAFLARWGEEAPRFLAREDAIKAFLHDEPSFLALCHWNANIDNGWYWRDEDGALQCGLMDWGSVGQMHVAMTLWGCLSGAETGLWDDHLEELVAQFAAAYREAGGPALDTGLLLVHLDLYVMMMGLAWLIDAPPRIRMEVPDPASLTGPDDPALDDVEMARVQLKVMANMLNLWARRDLGLHLRG